MDFTVLSFGKHKGKTLAQVLWVDPDWFFWAHKKKIFQNANNREAKFLFNRATSIKIPKGNPDDWKVEYLADTNGKYANMSIVDFNKPHHQGSSKAYYSEVINISMPTQMARYDKLGCRLIIKSLKAILFGNSQYRITKQRAEDFFNDDSNFVL